MPRNCYSMSPTPPRVCVYTNTYTLIINTSNVNKHEGKTCMTTRIYKWSQQTSLEAENANVPIRERSLDYKKTKQSDRFIRFLISYKLSVNKRVAVAYCCVSQSITIYIYIYILLYP